MTRRSAALVLACCLVLAGCGGFGVGDETVTTTPASAGPTTGEGPATERTTATSSEGEGDPSSASLPPGYTASGVNASVALETHLRALENVSAFALNGSIVGSGADLGTITISRRRGPSGERSTLRIEGDDRGTVIEGLFVTWSPAGEEIRYYRQRVASDGQTLNTTGVLQGSPGSRLIAGPGARPSTLVLGTVLADFAYDYNGTVEDEGDRLYRFDATGRADASDAEGRLASTNLTLLVDDSGLVREIRGAVVTSREGNRSIGRFDLRLSLRTPDPEAPAWADGIPAVRAELTGSGALAVHNGGPSAVVPGIVLLRGLRNPALSYEKPIPPGGTLYVYRTRVDGELRTNVSAVEPPAAAVVGWQAGTRRGLERLTIQLGTNHTHVLAVPLSGTDGGDGDEG